MWPVSERYTEVLTSSDRRWATLVDVYFGTERLTSLNVITDGKVEVDDVAVRRSLDLTMVDPTGELTPVAARDLLAPKGTEIVVSRGLWVDTDYEWVPLGVFGISDPEVSAHQNGTIIKVKGYDRVDAIRSRRFRSPVRIPGNTATHVAINAIINSRMPNITKRIQISAHTTPELLFDRLSDPWDAIQKLADSDAYSVFFDPLGSFICTLSSEQETGVIYEPGEKSLVVDATRTMSDENTYSGVVVTAEHPEETPIVYELWDNDPKSPTYAAGPFGYRPFGFSSPLIRTVAQARVAAEAILPRVTRFRQTAILTTIGYIGHEIGDIITVIDPETRMAGEWVVVGVSVPLRSGVVVLKLVERIITITSGSAAVQTTLSDSDNFDRAASSLNMGKTLRGRAWTPKKGTWGIEGTGRAYSSSAVDDDTVTIETGKGDVDIQATNPDAPAAGTWWGLVMNYIDTNNHWLLEIQPTGELTLNRRKSGANTEILRTTANTTAGQVVRVRKTGGNQFTLFRNGAQVGQTDTNQTDFDKSTQHGFRHGSRDTVKLIRWDNFSISDST